MHNIHPIFDRLIQRADREQFLEQKSKVVWLTGLSGSGKSTIAQRVERELFNQGRFAQVLDGDNIRSGINNNLGFSLEDRKENIRRIAEVAKLYLNSGIITLCSFISPTREIRDFARQIIGPDDFIEIYINAPLEVCESRDVKGLYKKARAGEIKGFTGIDSPYEAPLSPALELRTDLLSLDEASEEVIQLILRGTGNGERSTGTDYGLPAEELELGKEDLRMIEEQRVNYSKAQSFEDLKIWQLGIELVKEIYIALKDCKDFYYKDQTNRSALSVPSNIAEGFERRNNKEFLQFLYIAKASCGELCTQLVIGRDLKIINSPQIEALIDKSDKLSRMIANFIKFRNSINR